MVKHLPYSSSYIFGAVCPERDTGVALVLPKVSTAGMNLLLQEIASHVPERRHAVVLIDNAGWHTSDKIEVPENLMLVNLPPYSPELNAIERVWQCLRDRYPSGCLFRDEAAIIEACCNAWNRLVQETGRIRSLADRSCIHPVSP